MPNTKDKSSKTITEVFMTFGHLKHDSFIDMYGA